MEDLRGISIIQALHANDQSEWWMAMSLSYIGRIIAYLVILGLVVVIICLILRFLEECWVNRNTEETILHDSESSLLRQEKTVPVTYGTYDFGDLEQGDCNASSSVELYDGKVCIVCYEAERNCFFVPCGHSATCIACAKRIFEGESKTCPVCRRYIGKVKKLFVQ